MVWDESKHPRDDDGKFTFSTGDGSSSKTVLKGYVEKTDTENNSNDWHFDKTTKKENETKYRNKLLDVLGDKAKREDVLYSSIPELLSKIKDFGLENKLKQKFAELGLGGLYNYGGHWYAKKEYGEDTAGMVDIAHENPKNPNYAANTIELNSYEDIGNIADREYLKDKITKQFKDYGFDPKTIKGRIFPSNTEPSQRIAQDKDFIETIKNNKDKILNG